MLMSLIRLVNQTYPKSLYLFSSSSQIYLDHPNFSLRFRVRTLHLPFIILNQFSTVLIFKTPKILNLSPIRSNRLQHRMLSGCVFHALEKDISHLLLSNQSEKNTRKLQQPRCPVNRV